MQYPDIQKTEELQNLESPIKKKSASLGINKVSSFSTSKISELSISEEETSYILKNHQVKTNTQNCHDLPKFEIDLSSIHSSPQKIISNHLIELKSQIFTLTNKFCNHEHDAKLLAQENIRLKNQLVTLQENVIILKENSLQEKCKCKCNVF